MKKNVINLWLILLFYASLALISFPGCSKEDTSGNGNTVDDGFKTYLIRQGNHYCDQNRIQSVSLGSMNFQVKFDSSAIYQTVNPLNQLDINKLYGFSEGFNHQFNSARIGWRWSDGALRLFGYVYAEGTRHSQEITSISIDSIVNCSITINGNQYDFAVNSENISLPRGGTGSPTSGFQLYPYFGGDETSPRDISIKIKDF